MEEKLYSGTLAEVTSAYADITADEDNTADVNYKNYYSLYISYLEALVDEEDYTPADSTALYNLAQLCPGTNGSCIYQARALYNSIYNVSLSYSDCIDDVGARMANNDALKENSLPAIKQWDVELFPNPASDQITIVSKKENDVLTIFVKDLSGRNLLNKQLKTKKFIGSIDLQLINGAYLITIINSEYETVTKKLLIAK